MIRGPKILLVEGDADKLFFQACCDAANIPEGDVCIAPPTEVNNRRAGKMNAIDLLPGLIAQMHDGSVTHLAIIVDADYASKNGLGFDGTWQKITTILSDAKYNVPDKPEKNQNGFIFSHSQGLPSVGVWIMPNNGSTGFLEDFVKSTIRQTEKKFFKYATDAVNGLAERRFPSHHQTKAEIATWLAWQKTPGQTLASVVRNNFVELKSGQGKSFLDWLKSIYK
ncbi:DUF3226 domain-containing protein [Burkholderia cenocepacia]|uniref:DUF3226 domain-containing protein n=1 Tax=Burkholderia cenocepacia TaxID=95486 RepID=UPI0012F4B72C|nr:DUF3226 domain-containing protein [Burkholderia cenocepacia]